jgi:hypothetical protein
VAFLVAAVWYALVVAEVTVASEPRLQPGQAQEACFQTYYSWFASTLHQERYYTGAAIVGFLCLLVTATSLRHFGRRQPLAPFGAEMMSAGALLWVIGAVFAIGGHRAAGLMTEPRDPIATVNAITWTTDTINDAFELAGSALLGAGLLALAWAGSGLRSRGRAWSRYTLAVGLVLIATAGAYATQSFDLVDVLLVAVGAVLLPLWLALTGRLLSGGEETAFSD